jgi:hypothetical protein
MSEEVLVVGYAKMPEGTAVRAAYGTLSVGAIVNTGNHIVLRAWTTLASAETNDWVSTRLVGTDLSVSPSPFPDEIRRTYWGGAQAAICQCYRDLVRRYTEHLRASQDATP